MTDADDRELLEDEEPTMVDLTLTCTTEGCENQGVPITLSVPDYITTGMCGACGNAITPS